MSMSKPIINSIGWSSMTEKDCGINASLICICPVCTRPRIFWVPTPLKHSKWNTINCMSQLCQNIIVIRSYNLCQRKKMSSMFSRWFLQYHHALFVLTSHLSSNIFKYKVSKSITAKLLSEEHFKYFLCNARETCIQ